MNTTQLIGICAGVLTSGCLIPQLIKMIKEKKADDVSILMLVILLAGLGGWATYGYLKNDLPIMITNSFSFAVMLTILFFRFKYAGRK